MKIRVSRDDIRKGKVGDGCNCPVARALKRQTPFRRVNVGSEIQLGSTGIEDILDPAISVDSPRKVGRFIEAFDEGKPVKPFTFNLVIK